MAGPACSREPATPRGTISPSDVAAVPPDAKVTPSGLAYRVLSQGSHGKHPRPESRVLVNYTGWTTDGTIIEGAPIGSDPVLVELGKTMPGWREGVLLMSEGDKFRFWIPPKLALQGQAGQPQGMLVYDIYLQRFSDQ